MDKKIALLRGINVGGKRKLLMVELKALFESLTFQNIITYIQSGNVIFETAYSTSDIEIADSIEKAIAETFGYDVPVIVRSAQELKHCVAQNPFLQKENTDINELFLTFLNEVPNKENRLITETFHFEPDRFIIQDKNIFILCKGKYHQTKLSNNFFEKKLKVSATSRNWKTVLKLIELCG